MRALDLFSHRVSLLLWDVTHSGIRFVLPEVVAVGIFEVTLLPESGQNGPALPLQPDQASVLQDVLHQSLLVHHALLHSLEGALEGVADGLSKRIPEFTYVV